MDLVRELSRRDLLRDTSLLGTAALIASALPAAERILADPAFAAVSNDDATLQACADTILPGRKVARTGLGDEIHPDAIAGVDAEPGAVEADALRLYRNPLIGFETLAPPFLADLELRSLQQGGPFLSLDFARRTRVMLGGLDFGNANRVLYEAAAAVPFTAFCAGGEYPNATSKTFVGYRVMGHPGAAPNGYRDYSYRRRLARERTTKGYLA